MNQGMVFKIKKFALHDGPGIRTTVFLKGCALSCWWCHNPEGISPLREVMGNDGGDWVGQEMTLAQVLTEIEKDAVFYDESGGGATFSGGEPLLQPDFLAALLAGCRRRGIHTAIDTSGYAPPQDFARLAEAADLVLFDLKLMDAAAHRRYTGVDNRLILENFKALSGTGKAVRLRLPLVPGMTDGEDNLRAMARFVAKCAKDTPIDLLPYHRIGEGKYQRLGRPSKMAGTGPPADEAVARAAALLQEAGLSVYWEGRP